MSMPASTSRAVYCAICHKPLILCHCERDSAGVIDLDRLLADPEPFTVENIATQERGSFSEAHDVAVFMWGRDFMHYRIYRRGVLFPWTSGNLRAFEVALEAV